MVLVVLAVVAERLAAQEEYIVGPDDVLSVSFWQEPELNATVRVSEDGNIAVDIIGKVQAAGKTTTQLQDEIGRRMSRLTKNVSQAVVRVVEYNYNHVFVIGQVLQPGKKTFESIPDLWTILNEAGGFTDLADLSRVTIIRGGEQAGKVEVVNVTKAIQEGKLDQLPRIRREDTIEIPRAPVAVPSSHLSQTSERRGVVYVLGAVNDPGPKGYEEGLDFLDALALANGPLESADLEKARLIIKDGNYAQTITVNLDKYARTGRPARYILQREDTFIIPARRRASFLGVGLPAVAGVLGAVTSIILVWDRLSRD
jgi:polysaccharide export outer membrane protein